MAARQSSVLPLPPGWPITDTDTAAAAARTR